MRGYSERECRDSADRMLGCDRRRLFGVFAEGGDGAVGAGW